MSAYFTCGSAQKPSYLEDADTDWGMAATKKINLQ